MEGLEQEKKHVKGCELFLLVNFLNLHTFCSEAILMIFNRNFMNQRENQHKNLLVNGQQSNWYAVNSYGQTWMCGCSQSLRSSYDQLGQTTAVKSQLT